MIPICLSIAGSDPSGGAGIQADLKTFASLDCYGTSVITMLTVQNTQGVQEILEIPPEFVEKQIYALLEDMDISAIKIGAIGQQKTIRVLSKILSEISVPVILDPIRISSSGTEFLNDSSKNEMIEALFPLCTLITPNLVEATWLIESDQASVSSPELMGEKLLKKGADAVLITGISGPKNTKRDLLAMNSASSQTDFFWFQHQIIETNNSHGTGCTLSSAITSFMAKGHSIKEAVTASTQYLQKCLKNSVDFKTGKGIGALNHFS